MLLLIPHLSRLGVPIIAVTGNPQLRPWRAPPRVHLDVSVAEEACPLNLAPTASTTATLALGDALAVALLEARGFTLAGFRALASRRRARPQAAAARRRRHAHRRRPARQSVPQTSLAEGLVVMSKKGLGHVRRRRGRPLLGVFTDGDLRRVLDRELNVHKSTMREVMNSPGKRVAADGARGRSGPSHGETPHHRPARGRCRRARWSARSTCTTCCAPECCERSRAAFSRPCAACGCWCSTWTACSPTAGCSTARRANSLKAFPRARRARHQAGGRRRHHRRHHLRAQVGRGRCAARRELGIRHVTQGANDKLAALRKLAKARRVSLEECACVGDDTPDAPILAAAGLGIAVADAHADALAAARPGHDAPRRTRRGARGLRLADRGAAKARMKTWSRPLAYVAGRSP